MRELRGAAVPPARPVRPAPVETPMQALQRRYVEGSITVEEYEHELDRLFRPGRGSGPGSAVQS